MGNTDWLPELTDDDLSTLSEALEAWEHKDASGEMLGDLMEAVLTPKDPRVSMEYADTREREKVKRRRDAAVRKERSVVLRAKLLTLRDRRRVERAVAADVPRSTGNVTATGGD